MTEYISREDVYNVLTEYYHHSTEFQHEALREAIEKVPSADVVSSELFKVALDGIYERCQMLLSYWK